MNRIPDSDGQTSTKTDRTKGPFFPLQKKNGEKKHHGYFTGTSIHNGLYIPFTALREHFLF